MPGPVLTRAQRDALVEVAKRRIDLMAKIRANPATCGPLRAKLNKLPTIRELAARHGITYQAVLDGQQPAEDGAPARHHGAGNGRGARLMRGLRLKIPGRGRGAVLLAQAVPDGHTIAFAPDQLLEVLQPKRGKRSSAPAVDFEGWLARDMTVLGLPSFSRQFAYAPGRKMRADFAFEPQRLLVEVQGGIWRRGGGAHSHPTKLLSDIEKHQLAVINGWFVFPVTTDQVRNGEAVRLIEIALKARGWRP